MLLIGNPQQNPARREIVIIVIIRTEIRSRSAADRTFQRITLPVLVENVLAPFDSRLAFSFALSAILCQNLFRKCLLCESLLCKDLLGVCDISHQTIEGKSRQSQEHGDGQCPEFT